MGGGWEEFAHRAKAIAEIVAEVDIRDHGRKPVTRSPLCLCARPKLGVLGPSFFEVIRRPFHTPSPELYTALYVEGISLLLIRNGRW